MGRIMGLDYGLAHLGVALSDPGRIIASAFSVLEVKAGVMESLQAIIEAQAVDKIVLGLPRNKDGSLGPAAHRVQSFAQQLKQRFMLPVSFMDERFSTKSGEAALKAQGVSWRKSKALKDKVAAAIILQNFLDRNPGAGA